MFDELGTRSLFDLFKKVLGFVFDVSYNMEGAVRWVGFVGV